MVGDDRLLLLCGRDPRKQNRPPPAESVWPKKTASPQPDVPTTVGLGRAPVYLGNVNDETDPEYRPPDGEHSWLT
jgi:hypothetical protein